MPTGLYQTVAIFKGQTGLPEDDRINVWHFENEDNSDHGLVHNDIAGKLSTFYNTDLGASMTRAVAAYLSATLSRVVNDSQFVSYFTDDLSGETPFGSPVVMSNWTLGNEAAAVEYPSEVASCLSFHGDLTDVPETMANPTPPPDIIRPAARRRGRVYLGPLTDLSSDVSTEPRISTTFMVDIAAAAANLASTNDTLSAWCVWSKADAALYQVVGGFVDNAYDIQRRRGVAATTRQLWT